MDVFSDNQLMEQVRDGKVEKMAILFERYHVMLFNFMLRLTGNKNMIARSVKGTKYLILHFPLYVEFWWRCTSLISHTGRELDIAPGCGKLSNRFHRRSEYFKPVHSLQNIILC